MQNYHSIHFHIFQSFYLIHYTSLITHPSSLKVANSIIVFKATIDMAANTIANSNLITILDN
jgi:hypothetical protein